MVKLTLLLSLLSIFSFSIFIVDNLIHSVFLLILLFLTSSFILFLMQVDFLGFAFIIIYVGAIAVLFLFVIMMINIKNIENTKAKSFKLFILICCCCGIFFNQWSFFFYHSNLLYWDLNISRLFDSFDNIFLISKLLYSFYNFSFLIAGLILLVAMLGAILLTMNFKPNSLSQLSPKQNARISYFNNSTFFIKKSIN